MKQNLIKKPEVIRGFSVTGMTGQNRHNWPDLFYQGKFFEVLSKGVAKGWVAKNIVMTSSPLRHRKNVTNVIFQN